MRLYRKKFPLLITQCFLDDHVKRPGVIAVNHGEFEKAAARFAEIARSSDGVLM
jgi:hypothetical protein